MLIARADRLGPTRRLRSVSGQRRPGLSLGGRGFALGLWSAIAVAVTLSAGAQVLERRLPGSAAVQLLADVFHVDEEQSLPTLLSVLLLLACSAMLAAVAVASRRQVRPDARQWWVVSGLFVVLALDEHLSLHERLIEPVRDGMGVDGAFHFAWVLPALVLVAGLSVWFAPFVWRLPRDVRWLVVLAAGVYLMGAIGAEMVAGWLIDRGDRPFTGLVTLEEAMEMSGAALMLLAARRHLRDHLGGGAVTLHVGG